MKRKRGKKEKINKKKFMKNNQKKKKRRQMSIPDPISVIKEWAQKKKTPEIRDGKVIFNNVWYSKDLKTRFKSLNGGHYTLEAICYGLENASEQYGNYVTKCIENKIPMISLMDLKPLVKYVNGELESTEKLDNDFKVDLENHSGILAEKRPNADKSGRQPNKKQKQGKLIFLNMKLFKKIIIFFIFSNPSHIDQRVVWRLQRPAVKKWL